MGRFYWHVDEHSLWDDIIALMFLALLLFLFIYDCYRVSKRKRKENGRRKV